MTKVNKIKKVSALALILFLLSTLFVSFGNTVEAKASVAPVKMYSAQIIQSYYGYSTTKVFIQVQNISDNKNVSLHVKDSYNSNVWTDIPGEYLSTLSDGSEIWQADIGSYGNLEYAIKCEANGQVYWDNNSNNNYTQDDVLGVALLSVNRAYTFYNNGLTNYQIKAIVKNLEFNKIVKIRYTDDNWASQKDAYLNYSKTNDDGTEYWQTSIGINPQSVDKFQYAISYEVNGQTYWDNNFGRNFNGSYSSYY